MKSNLVSHNRRAVRKTHTSLVEAGFEVSLSVAALVVAEKQGFCNAAVMEHYYEAADRLRDSGVSYIEMGRNEVDENPRLANLVKVDRGVLCAAVGNAAAVDDERTAFAYESLEPVGAYDDPEVAVTAAQLASAKWDASGCLILEDGSWFEFVPAHPRA